MNNISTTARDETESNNVIPHGICKEDFREQIFKMQDCMMDMKDNHVESPLFHYFAPGMYVREIHMQKGAVIIGKIHRHSHVNIISKGIVDVVTESGTARYEAPYTFVSEPETKRLVNIIEDTIWTTVHAVDSEDLEQIESELIMPDYDNLIDSGDKS